jgi:hypothetical protein
MASNKNDNGVLDLDIELESAKQKLTPRKRSLIDALESTMGIVSPACKKANVARGLHYQWMKEDPVYSEAFNDVMEMQIDFAESSLLKKIKEGSTAETIFYLKCKGKKRGYVEKDIEKPVEVNVNVAVADTNDVASFLGIEEDE